MSNDNVRKCAVALQHVIDTNGDEKAIEEYVAISREAGSSERAIASVVEEARKLCASKIG